MPKIEIEESDFRALRGASQLLDQLQNSPKTRRTFQSAVKVLHPDTVTDEDRVAESPEVLRLNRLETRLDAFLTKSEENEVDGKLNAAFERLRTRDAFTPDGIEAVKRLMVERKIPDPEAAAALWEKQNPPAAIQPNSLFQSSGFGFGQPTEDADRKLLFEDEDAFAEREFIKAMNEPA